MSIVCPWWFCPSFDNVLRKLLHDPAAILGNYVKKGDTALDIGCGMGYFTIPMARLVGETGQVIAADLQSQMLSAAQRRAERSGVNGRITFHRTAPYAIGLTEQVDFALAFWMLHEVKNRPAFLADLRSLVKQGGKFLLVEPRLHVSEANFTLELEQTKTAGFVYLQPVDVRISRGALLG